MPPKKTATLNLRVDPALKEAARVAALREHRSVANLVEYLIRQHCSSVGIRIPEQAELFPEGDDHENT
jgi:predicted HicB family RNase H-like nuclease